MMKFILILAFSCFCCVHPFSATLCSGKHKKPVVVQLSSGNGNGQFDVSKKVLDPLSLRQIRGDALVRYNTLNQSEPLRINLYGLATLSLLFAPLLAEELSDGLSIPQTILSEVGAVGALVLFVRECQARSRQLNRIEKELQSELLGIRLPNNALADRPFKSDITLKQLRMGSTAIPPRIIAICGQRKDLKESLEQLSVLGKRLEQSSTFVVPVATDSSKREDFWEKSSLPGWLAEPGDEAKWRSYFKSLSGSSGSTSSFQWFALNSSGRSFGSGVGDQPQWLELMGQFLRPTVLLDETDPPFLAREESEDTKQLTKLQDSFYKALTTGDSEQLQNIFSSSPSEAVSEVCDAGGRMDNWESCLATGARPEGMKVSGSDVVVITPTLAFTTIVEFPGGFDAGTLLAVQQWTRTSTDKPWGLRLHQTIPWSTEVKAQGTLRCDCRGCVALTRGPDRRTYGGLIG